MTETICKTEYDLERLLRAAADAIDAIPASMIRQVSENLEKSVDHFERRIQASHKHLLDIQQAYADYEEKACKMADEAYDKLKATKQRLEAKLTELKNFPDLSWPYALKEIVVFAERCSVLDDTQWARVIELAKALKR